MGQGFDADQLKPIGADMQPNTSALVVIIEDKAMEAFVHGMGETGAQIVTASVGSQLSGELSQVAAIDLGEDGAAIDGRLYLER